MISKKDKVRQHLLTLNNGATFTVSSIARDCTVSTKDVTNVVGPMYKHGVFERESKNGFYVYTVDTNALNLYSAKYPRGQANYNKKAANPKSNGAHKKRPSVLVQIDKKIDFYKTKIDILQAARKELR